MVATTLLPPRDRDGVLSISVRATDVLSEESKVDRDSRVHLNRSILLRTRFVLTEIAAGDLLDLALADNLIAARDGEPLLMLELELKLALITARSACAYMLQSGITLALKLSRSKKSRMKYRSIASLSCCGLGRNFCSRFGCSGRSAYTRKFRTVEGLPPSNHCSCAISLAALPGDGADFGPRRGGDAFGNKLRAPLSCASRIDGREQRRDGQEGKGPAKPAGTLGPGLPSVTDASLTALHVTGVVRSTYGLGFVGHLARALNYVKAHIPTFLKVVVSSGWYSLLGFPSNLLPSYSLSQMVLRSGSLVVLTNYLTFARLYLGVMRSVSVAALTPPNLLTSINVTEMVHLINHLLALHTELTQPPVVV
nr:hypothetical protein HmN_000930100 [Hymenolepis microstoma]